MGRKGNMAFFIRMLERNGKRQRRDDMNYRESTCKQWEEAMMHQAIHHRLI
jgi:hypothetical protein